MIALLRSLLTRPAPKARPSLRLLRLAVHDCRTGLVLATPDHGVDGTDRAGSLATMVEGQ